MSEGNPLYKAQEMYGEFRNEVEKIQAKISEAEDMETLENLREQIEDEIMHGIEILNEFGYLVGKLEVLRERVDIRMYG